MPSSRPNEQKERERERKEERKKERRERKKERKGKTFDRPPTRNLSKGVENWLTAISLH